MFGGCTNFYKTRLGFAWKNRAVLGFAYFSQEFLVFSSWPLGIWNSVCISASASLGLFRVNINDGEIRFRLVHSKYDIRNEINILLTPDFLCQKDTAQGTQSPY